MKSHKYPPNMKIQSLVESEVRKLYVSVRRKHMPWFLPLLNLVDTYFPLKKSHPSGAMWYLTVD